MNDNNKEDDIVQIIDRLARIETKIDNFKSTQDLCNKNKNDIIKIQDENQNQQKQIDEINDNNKWFKRTIISAIITEVVAIIFICVKIFFHI